MPYWWSTEHWRRQFPLDTVVNTYLTMSMIKGKFEPHHDVRYCPDWTAPNKAGAPKKGKRLKSPAEQASKKRKPRPYCVICNNYKHTTAECYRNEHKSGDENDEDAEDDNNGYATAKDDGNDDDDTDGAETDGRKSGEDDESESESE